MFLKYFLFSLSLFFLCNCSSNLKKSNSEQTIHSGPPTSYSYGKLYRDLENDFRIQYPKNWELVAGEAKHTVVKFINRDSSMSLSINVIQNDGSMSEEKLDEIQLNNFKTYVNQLMISVNKIPIDLKVENGYLDNHNAVITSNKFVLKQINLEILFQYYQIQTLVNGKIYNVILSLPEKYFTESYASYISNFIYSFRFDP